MTASYTNPVLDRNFPDPFVLRANDRYYAYATNHGGLDVQLSESADLVHWSEPVNALPALPAWAARGWTWAPEVAPVPGGYAMYYVARHAASGLQCTGVATSARPEGPFEDRSSEPLVAMLELGGAIDASPFTDADGSRYLLWKNDGNAVTQPTILFAARLSDDGLRLASEPVELFRNTEAWEGHVVEAPFLWRHENLYYLFYSGNDFGNERYGIGFAVGASPLGPFIKWPLNPILRSSGDAAGPGHQCLVRDDAGDDWLVYHAWAPDRVGYAAGGARSMRLDRVTWERHVPAVRATSSEQPAPRVTRTR